MSSAEVVIGTLRVNKTTHVYKHPYPINPSLTSGLVQPYYLHQSISNLGVSSDFFFTFIVLLIEIPVSKQCNPDQMPHVCGI